MKKYRTFEVQENGDKLHGIIELRADDEEKKVFQKLRAKGFKINRRVNKLVWWNYDFAEIINKKTELTVAYMDLCYR